MQKIHLYITSTIFLFSSWSFSANADEPINLHLKKSKPEKPTKINYIGLQYGGNCGAYFGNKTTASYYNGSHVSPYGNSMDSTDVLRIINNPFNYTKIKEAVGGYDFMMGDYPSNTKYVPALCFGLFVKYQLTDKIGFLAQFNYTKLHTSDIFTIITDKYNSGFSQPYYYECNISGTESRTNVDIGMSYSFKKENQKRYPFIEAGVNMNEVNVKSYDMKINSLIYSLMNPYNIQNYIVVGGVGFGGFTSLGYQVEFNKKTLLNIGATEYLTQVKLGDNPKYAFNSLFFIRIIFV